MNKKTISNFGMFLSWVAAVLFMQDYDFPVLQHIIALLISWAIFRCIFWLFVEWEYKSNEH